MTLTGPPLTLQSGSHAAAKFRQFLDGLMVQEGVGGINDMLVKQQVAPAQSVLVSAGLIFMKGTSSSVQGTYADFNDADVTVAASAADAALSRIDRVIYRVRDPDFVVGTPQSTYEYINGTAGSGVPPTVPVDSVSLAQVSRAANQNTIATAQITDERVVAAAVGGVIVCTSSTHPGSPRIGQMIYETDTGNELTWNGSAWVGTNSIRLFTATPVSGSSLSTVSIPSWCTWLRIRQKIVNNTAAADFGFRLNGDSGGNYAVQSGFTLAGTTGMAYARMGVNNNASGFPSQATAEIHDLQNSTQWHVWHVGGVRVDNATNPNIAGDVEGGIYKVNAALTSIQPILSAGAYAAGSWVQIEAGV